MVLETLTKLFRIKEKTNSSLTTAISNVDPNIKEIEINEMHAPSENHSVNNFNWLAKNWATLVKDGLVNGGYVLISDKQIINSSDMYSNLENEAKISGLENYDIIHI